MKLPSILDLFALLIHLSALAAAADTNAWKSRNIYFALTDRLARDNDAGGGSCGNLGDYCGGTFRGLQGKLDYIRGMGFDAIWITPVVENSAGGYHGYWAENLYEINPRHGSADDLKSLVKAAHDKGMYVMVDVVANHVGNAPRSDNGPDILKLDSSYHTPCNIDYNNQSSIEVCSISGLPDLKTESSDIRNTYRDWVKWLVSEFGFDGLRIDTVKHVEKDYWPGFVNAAGVYAVGEVFNGDPTYLAGYASVVPGLLNYAMYYPMNRFFMQQGSSQDVVDMHNQIGNLFPDPSVLGNFLDNHDNARWLNQKNDVTLLKNALAHVVLSRGIPILYYGTEQGFSGGNDPQNREDLWRSNFDTNSDLYKSISKLISARKVAGGLGDNDHKHLYVVTNAYAWSRAGGNLVVLTTNAGGGHSQQHCFNTQRPNVTWKDVWDGSKTYSSDGSGQVCVDSSNGDPVVLLAQQSAGAGRRRS